MRTGATVPERPSSDAAASARSLFDSGMRHVTFPGPVVLAPARQDTERLDLVRELSAWAVVCAWELRCDDPALDWTLLSHLYPPAAVEGDYADRVDLDGWRSCWYPGRCILRHGPGFVELRDRRRDTLERFVVDDEPFLGAVRDLSAGAAPASLDPAVTRTFTDHGLLVGGVWWAPARVRRWPVPAMII